MTNIKDRLRALGLLVTAADLDDLIATATKKRWGHLQLIEHVVDVEEKDRARRGLERRRARSRLERFKPMADLDWNWPKKIDRHLVESAVRLDFIESGQLGLPRNRARRPALAVAVPRRGRPVDSASPWCPGSTRSADPGGPERAVPREGRGSVVGRTGPPAQRPLTAPTGRLPRARGSSELQLGDRFRTSSKLKVARRRPLRAACSPAPRPCATRETFPSRSSASSTSLRATHTRPRRSPKDSA